MDNQKKQDLEKIFKAGGDAICLPNDKPQTLTQFLNENEDLALRLGAVVGRSEQLKCEHKGRRTATELVEYCEDCKKILFHP